MRTKGLHKLTTRFPFTSNGQGGVNWQEAYFGQAEVGIISCTRPRPWQEGSNIYRFRPNELGQRYGFRATHGTHQEVIAVPQPITLQQWQLAHGYRITEAA